MTASKLCGRITDHTGHHWPGRAERVWAGGIVYTGPSAGVRVEHWCPGHVVIEGGQRSRHTRETLYDRLPDLVDGLNALALRTGIRRRVTVCFTCAAQEGPHFIARRIDTMPESVMR